jgi:hypothetical protein
MPDDFDEIKATLGALCGLGDTPVRRLSPKLNSVEPGSVEAFYMVATFCFDLQRKLEYMCKATLEYESRMDSGLAREILADNEALQAEGLSWKQRAELAEEIMLRLYREVGPQHEKGLQRAAKG